MPLISALEKERQAELSMSSRPLWSIEWVPGQSGLYKETLTWGWGSPKQSPSLRLSLNYSTTSRLTPITKEIDFFVWQQIMLSLTPKGTLERKKSTLRGQESEVRSLWSILVTFLIHGQSDKNGLFTSIPFYPPPAFWSICLSKETPQTHMTHFIKGRWGKLPNKF